MKVFRFQISPSQERVLGKPRKLPVFMHKTLGGDFGDDIFGQGALGLKFVVCIGSQKHLRFAADENGVKSRGLCILSALKQVEQVEQRGADHLSSFRSHERRCLLSSS